MIILTTTSSGRDLGESVLFQLVLRAYPTCHSWLITAHISLGHLEHNWKSFNRQLIRTHQLLQFMNQQPSALTYMTLHVELSNIDDIYNSCKPTIISAINLINTNPSFDLKSQQSTHHKLHLLPFLGDALRWLTGTSTMKDGNNIKTRVNQLIVTQSSQQDTLVHIVSILNVTQYAVQVNRHSINILMDQVDKTSHDINNLYNQTTSLATSIRFYQLILHIRSVLANLHDSLCYIRMVSTHTLDYINAATSGILSPHILPTMDLQKILIHIEETLPPMLHLLVSSDNTLHFIDTYTHTCSDSQQGVFTANQRTNSG